MYPLLHKITSVLGFRYRSSERTKVQGKPCIQPSQAIGPHNVKHRLLGAWGFHDANAFALGDGVFKLSANLSNDEFALRYFRFKVYVLTLTNSKAIPKFETNFAKL